VRTPYDKLALEHDPYVAFDRLLDAGYVVVAQDARGRHASDGEWESFVRFETHDAEDGYDAVE
jgi:predicted acyl esterase